MQSKNLGDIDGFYFIGAGGVSMSALAQYVLFLGKKVGGEDIASSVYTDELLKLGADIAVGDTKIDISGYGAIVYTDAVGENNPRLCRARSLNKKVFSRGEFLSLVCKDFKKVIAVSGCHGKTTCTAMLAHIFYVAGEKFSAHIGGRDMTFKNAYFGGNDLFITEACEYKKNFLRLDPDIALVLNIGADHLECYGSTEALKGAFATFAGKARECVFRENDLAVCGKTFGFSKNADYRADCFENDSGKYGFTVYEHGTSLGRIKLNVYGEHNVSNALAAIAAARTAGLDFAVIAEGISGFKGVERRFERLGCYNGAPCIADYAHHPDEITAILNTVKQFVKGKIFVVFQPHTYSRTKALFKEFVKVLSGIDELLIYKTFAAREYYDDAGSALTLYQAVKRAKYGDNAGDITDFIARAGKGDAVLFLGAGDIYFIARKIVK